MEECGLKFSHEEILHTVPTHLRGYVVRQEYEKYTPQDHAVWRNIMRRNIRFLKENAHPAYMDGLQKTGITTERIPDIREMNQALDRIGWRAVVVNGFLPPAAFMEFQANRILVISAEMRTIDHILYTPAPDIVHEAAGHAPFIAHETYAQYLQRFGEYGARAISSKLDFEIYESIRALSIIKEYPHAKEADIRSAENRLQQKLEANQKPSEAALLSRLHWWTVEYGLIGTPQNYKQYGAGLLSSVGESKACLNERVKKLPLDLNCVTYDYDITSMQPQLFVAENWEHLLEVLENFAATMAFRRAGLKSLKMAMEAESVATVMLSSGLQISGKLSGILNGENGSVRYVHMTGPAALACEYREIKGHGTDMHPEGFGFAPGLLAGAEKPLELHSDDELNRIGIIRGKKCRLEMDSGITIEGTLTEIRRAGKYLQMLSFTHCRVTDRDGSMLFKPESGRYDMAVGEKITSVFQGSADKEKFNVLPPVSENKAIPVDYSARELTLFDLYQSVRNLRRTGRFTSADIRSVLDLLDDHYPEDWLLRLEIAELLNDLPAGSAQKQKVLIDLDRLRSRSEAYEDLISAGLEELGR